MARRQRGRDLANKPVLQPGATISDEQDFSTKGHAVYVGDAASYPNRPKRGDPHPLDENCLCYAVVSTMLKLGKIQYDCDFLGLSADPTPYFLEFVGSAGEVALETHPNFASVIGGTPAAPLHNAKFDAETGAFLGFPADAPDQLGGVSTYFLPSVIVRSSYWSLTKPNPGALGHIIDPATVPDLVLPPNCLDLLVTNFGYRHITPGKPPYQITVECLGSDINGWNQLIYPLS